MTLPVWLTIPLAVLQAFLEARWKALFADRREAREKSAQEAASLTALEVSREIQKMDPDVAAAHIRRRVRDS